MDRDFILKKLYKLDVKIDRIQLEKEKKLRNPKKVYKELEEFRKDLEEVEKQVEEKYYLSDKMIEFFTYNTEKQKNSGNGFMFKPISADDSQANAKTITTRNGTRMDDNFISDKIEHVADLNYYNHDQSNRVYGAQPCAPTLRTKADEAQGIKIIEENEKGIERERNYGQRGK